MTDAMTMAARTAVGRLRKSGARTTAVARISPAVISDDELGPVARRLAGRGLAEAGIDREATEQAAGDVRRAERDQLLVRVDVVAVPRTERAGRPDRFGEGEEDDPERSRDQEDQVAEREVGDAREREAGGDLADGLDALGGQVERGREDDADDQRDERAGHPRREAPEEQDADQGADAEDGGGRVDQADRFLDHRRRGARTWCR